MGVHTRAWSAMVMRGIAGLLVVCLVSGPWVDVVEAQTTMTTDLGTYVLTSSGVTKVQSAAQTVGKGLGILSALGKLVGPISVGLAVFELAWSLWDWYEAKYSSLQAPGTPFGPAGNDMNYTWGTNAGSLVRTCTYASDGANCSVQKLMADEFAAYPSACIFGAVQQNTGTQNVNAGLYGLNSGCSVVSGSRVMPAVGVDRNTERQTVLNTFNNAITELQALPQSVRGTGSVTHILSDLVAARNVLRDGVELLPSDIQATNPTAVTGQPNPITGANPGTGAEVTGGGGSGSTQVYDETVANKLTATPSTAATPVCPTCDRSDRWSEFWNTLKTAGQSAPVFGLISKLLINPAGGQSVCSTRTITTSMMGTLTVDPSVWNCSTLVAVFRFSILGTCVIVAYMILFG